MREIKFRAWDIVAKQMIELHGWQDDPATYNRYRIMQFTGLLDKNGKEIYEGDIVQPVNMYDDNLNYWMMKDRKAIPLPTEVKWDECRARFKLPSGLDAFEVIGNIYEHSHLLEKDGE